MVNEFDLKKKIQLPTPFERKLIAYGNKTLCCNKLLTITTAIFGCVMHLRYVYVVLTT